MDEQIYPYVIKPKEVPLIWGGHALVRRYGKAGDPNVKLGESWECWDENLIANGPLSGRSIADLRTTMGAAFLGSIDASRIFPILTKIIDAQDKLSVQVHPDDAYARGHEHQPFGKTECWYILDADPGAKLFLGWARDTSRAEYEQRVRDGSLGEILAQVAVKAGDVFFVPAGTVHAIGAGIQLFETQQASDLTYRMFDWNRVGTDGKPRQLHVEKAGDVLNYKRGTTGAIPSLTFSADGLEHTALVADRRFTVERIRTDRTGGSIELDAMPLIVMSLDNSLTVAAAGTEVALDPYTTALVPAAAQRASFRAASTYADFLAVAVPASAEAYRRRLANAGISGERTEQFLAGFAAAETGETRV